MKRLCFLVFLSQFRYHEFPGAGQGLHVSKTREASSYTRAHVSRKKSVPGLIAFALYVIESQRQAIMKGVAP
jgi:hypothetical protein